MPKPQDIFQLARQEAVRVTASPQAWQSFLYTAAHNYHTTYLNQLLIHAQRPDAAACASMEYWNTKANRLVMRGSRCITVLQRRQGVAVTKPVFAIGDTTLLSQTHTGGPWEVTDTTRPLLLQDKSDDWLTALAQDGVSNDADCARRMLERNVADSTLQWAQPDEQMQLLQALVTQSAVYMARLRIGLPVQDEDYPAFQSVSQFDTCQISLCLGGYVQAAAEPMLNAIGREALRLSRDSIALSHELVHNESTRTQLNSRQEAVTHDVHEEPRRLPDSEPFPAEPAEPLPEPLREAASGISGTERADTLRPTDAGGHAADELQSNRTDSTADGGQDPARADADHPDAGPQDEPAGLGTADQQPEEAGGGSSPSDAVRNLTESPAQAESEQSPSAFALPEFPPTLLPQLLAMETSSRASNAEYLTFYNKNPLLIDRLRFVRESYKDIFTELLLADDTRVGFHKQDSGLLVWKGAYLTRSAETLLSWRAVANALNDLNEQHELIATTDPKKLPQVEEQLSFELPDGAPTSAEDDRLEKGDFLTPEKQETVIRSALPVAEYNAPQMDDGSVITDEEINLALAVGSNFENSKFRIYQQFTTTQGDHAAFLKKEYGSGGRSWDYQSGAHGWVDHGPAGLKLILTNEEGRFERRLPWRAAAKRIAYLIEMQRFLTQQELEQYPAWAAEQREPASVVRDEPGTIPDTRPICTEGSVVYLEDDHRFTVERIEQFDVHLRDEEVPLIGRAISREEFQRQLDANPRNGGMMLSEQQRTALVQAQTEQALSYIEDYFKDEFEITEPDFSDLTRIDLGYTTTEDEKHVIQVYADLEHCTVTKLVDDTLYAQERYGSLDDLNQAVLSNLDFDSLMEIDLDEAEEHELQENTLPADESYAQAPTNYLAPYEPEVPSGAKAKFAANLNAIRTLKQIEQRGTPATEAEQDVLAGYLGWGGLADAFDPNKNSWHSEYEHLKNLLTPEEYAAAQESTLTAFYTPPAVIHAMYRVLTRMGCVGGNVLEPSMGVGAFFGHRSGSFDMNNAKLYGVELDSVSGRIAQQLYQKAKIQICGYEKADLPDSFFDLAIGNVPFGQYQVTDRQYDKLHFQIHDYFLAKTVDKLRVGGIMAFITTSGTMDKKSESVRRYLAARCDLIGAVRLPNNTFTAQAGTTVTSDILFLQKRGRVLEQDAPWIHVGETADGIPLNRYFIDHPEMICGEMQMVSGPYGQRPTCAPLENGASLEGQLDAALANLQAEYTLADDREDAQEESDTLDADPGTRNFSYVVKDATVYYRENSKMRAVKASTSALARIKALVPLRDTCRELIRAQLDNLPDETVAALQAQLTAQYDSYHDTYGLINSRGTASAFREDSGYFLLCSLEDIDMYMKCMYMDELTGGHGIVFATGTPISNSMTEMYIMMRYLQYGILEQEGLLNFDAWASTFGESVTAIELAPEGNGYRSKTRFAKFYNLPELMNMFKQCADIQTADMLKLPVPEITGGKPTIVKLPPSELQRQMVAALGERAEAVRNRLVAPNEDNMLRITNDGRKLALDQRLMNPLLPDDPDSKANACVERVFTIWEKTKAQRSTQMIFCDLSTPRADGFDVYNDIRDKLVARGIPKEEVQFIHDADTEAKKAELFGKVRSGAVRVLMGSTQKMGAGTNVQTRLCALHHLDCPWRPADIAQRNGRMVRQGNMNKEVSIFIYITEATFDAYSYQLVENKQKFISQIMTSKSPARSCEDLDEAALSYAEVKALAAGNPMIKEKMDLDIQVARLRTLKAAYNSQHYRLEDAVTGIFLREIRGTECRIQAFEKDMQTAKDSQSYDKDGKLVFSIELDGTTYDKREDAGKALLGLLGAAVRADHHVLVGHYAGFEVTVAYVPLSKVFVAHLVGQATHTTELGSDAAGNMVRLQNVVAALPQDVSGLRNNLQQLRVQLDSAKEELQQPFLAMQVMNELPDQELPEFLEFFQGKVG